MSDQRSGGISSGGGGGSSGESSGGGRRSAAGSGGGVVASSCCEVEGAWPRLGGALRQAGAAMERSADNLHSPSAPASSSAAVDGRQVFAAHMLAGAVAGVTEHTAMYPVDTIKTRMQALSHPGQRLHGSVINALRAVLRREGVAGLYRGVGAVAAGAGPAHALHFAVYEAAKERLGGNRAGYQWAATAGAGAVATVVNDGLMTPVDVIKQRLQVAHSPYRGLVDCTATVLRQEGVAALYRSYRTTVLMNIPFVAMHFSVYEAAKKWLLRIDAGDEEAEDRLAVQLVAGGLAGGAAAAVTTPLDVVKTRLQTEGVLAPKRYGTTAVLPVLRRIVAEEGLAAIWRGVKPRVLFNCPAAAVSWGTYESMKRLLLGDPHDADGER
ncbi:SPAC8C9.12c [Scenedesmus sp. PABB004]|nr:SPAC8C9.12c [Scenedesmus sp. PABB004]